MAGVGEVAALFRYPVKSMLGEALETARQELASTLQNLALAREELAATRKLLAEREAELSTSEADLAATRDALGARETELTAREIELADARRAQEQQQIELGALRDRSKVLTSRLATAEERTLLAQEEIDKRGLPGSDPFANSGSSTNRSGRKSEDPFAN